MDSSRCTVVHFSYGGYYSKEGGETIWIPSEDKVYAVVIKKSFEEVTYYDLLSSIYQKLRKDEATTSLILSYITLHLEPPMTSYISNDEEVFAYFMTLSYEKRWSILNVEVVKDLSQGHGDGLREDQGSVVGVSTEDNERGMITLHGEEPIDSDFLEDNPLKDNQLEENPLQDNPLEENPLQDNPLEENPLEDNPLEGNPIEGDDVMGNDGVNVGWEDGVNVSVGQYFGTKREVQDIVEKAALVNCFNFDTINSDTKVYVVKCSEAGNGCKWYLRASKPKNLNVFAIRTHRNIHTCSRSTIMTSQGRRKGTPRLVASLLHEDYPGQLETPSPKVLIGLTHRKLGVQVSYATALRGKQKAANDLRGSPEESYMKVCSYLYMLERVNPGTITRVEVDENQRFKYLFFALGACIEGFEFMRKVIVIDGTHLKTVFGGVLIVATAQDPDHHHYPIAFGVVDGEKDASWGWFLKMLKSVVHDSSDLVFLSDRNQSIIKCISEVYPLSHHGYCMYHLSQNVKASVNGVNKAVIAMKFMECAEAYTEAEFTKLYDAFRMRYPTAAAYLDRSVGECKWSRCYFPGERYNILTTNIVESINSIFLTARKYALLPMIDIIVEKIGEWFNKHRKSSVEIPHGQKLVPYVDRILHARCKDAVLLVVHERNSYMLEYSVIGHDGYTYLVDLRRKTCSCKRFDLDKYPCVHALVANYNNKMGEIDVCDWCSKYNWVEMWALAYHRTIYPVPDQKDWVVPPEVEEKTILPPVYEKKRVEFNKQGSHQLENIVEKVGDVGLLVEDVDQVRRREKQVKVGEDQVKVGEDRVKEGVDRVKEVEACSVGFVETLS